MERKQPKPGTLRELEEFKDRWRQWIMCDRELTPTNRVALYFMADSITTQRTALEYEAVKDVVINPSQGRIAAQAGVSRLTANQAVGRAIAMGYVQRVSRGSKGATSKYRIMPVAQKAAFAVDLNNRIDVGSAHDRITGGSENSLAEDINKHFLLTEFNRTP
jgi:hypothetical protein